MRGRQVTAGRRAPLPPRAMRGRSRIARKPRRPRRTKPLPIVSATRRRRFFHRASPHAPTGSVARRTESPARRAEGRAGRPPRRDQFRCTAPLFVGAHVWTPHETRVPEPDARLCANAPAPETAVATRASRSGVGGVRPTRYCGRARISTEATAVTRNTVLCTTRTTWWTRVVIRRNRYLHRVIRRRNRRGAWRTRLSPDRVRHRPAGMATTVRPNRVGPAGATVGRPGTWPKTRWDTTHEQKASNSCGRRRR